MRDRARKSPLRQGGIGALTARGVVFDGPLCRGLSSEAADVDLPWTVLVDASGRLVLDAEGRPQVAALSDRTVNLLEPIPAKWLTPDVKNPTRKRVWLQIMTS